MHICKEIVVFTFEPNHPLLNTLIGGLSRLIDPGGGGCVTVSCHSYPGVHSNPSVSCNPGGDHQGTGTGEMSLVYLIDCHSD